jgi:hypothetical protein
MQPPYCTPRLPYSVPLLRQRVQPGRFNFSWTLH